MEKIGRELSSFEYWQQNTDEYVENLTNDYHKHRLSVAKALIPSELFQPEKRVFDFGCGDAAIFPWFLSRGADITGVDTSPEMISRAREKLGNEDQDAARVQVGGVDKLSELEAQSVDAIISFNVLAYLSRNEEAEFYRQAQRVVKPGGWLVVTHSNELFDLFSLNRHTATFFERHLVDAAFKNQVADLLACADQPAHPTTYNVRENPLAYRFKLAEFGFQEERQEFINLHLAPPPLLEDKTYPDTLNTAPQDRWRLMFACSTFGSCARRA